MKPSPRWNGIAIRKIIYRQVLHRLIAMRRSIRYYALERLEMPSGLGDSAWALYGLVRSMKPQVCVEIGSAQGRSACFIGTALRDNGMGKLYAIDPHCQTDWNDTASIDTYSIMMRNIRRLKLQKHVEIVREMSNTAAQRWSLPIDLLFIDGDHSYEGVKYDWNAFVSFVQPFGLVIFHDTLWNLRPDPKLYRDDMGVPRFVEELREQGYPVITFEHDFGVSLIQPVQHGIALRRVP
jgi:predicted O-methyltransferase YrrM